MWRRSGRLCYRKLNELTDDFLFLLCEVPSHPNSSCSCKISRFLLHLSFLHKYSFTKLLAQLIESVRRKLEQRVWRSPENNMKKTEKQINYILNHVDHENMRCIYWCYSSIMWSLKLKRTSFLYKPSEGLSAAHDQTEKTSSVKDWTVWNVLWMFKQTKKTWFRSKFVTELQNRDETERWTSSSLF